ncbi:XRE family transcriptional regulator [Candidatus Saccharibacteria bacterium]|nr:MAG: XRE family transcriptional regulator [Candidatus Saccharibacteria bacterium]
MLVCFGGIVYIIMTDGEQEKTRRRLGKVLHEAREAAGLTQQEVATKAGVHVNFYARVERGEGNPSFEKLQSIMKALGIQSLDLL